MPKCQSHTENHSRVALALFFATLTVRFWALFQLSDSPYVLPESGDMRFYYDWALRFLDGNWTDGKAFYGLPGYPMLMSIVFWLTGPSSLLLGMIQAVLDGIVSILIFRISILISDKPTPSEGPECRNRSAVWIGVLAAVAWMLLLPAQAFSIILMPTSWAICTFWILVTWLVKMTGPRPWWVWLGMGLLTGGVSILVATLLFLIPLVFAAALIYGGCALRGGRPGLTGRAVACALFMGGVITGLSPCWVHNYFIAKEHVFLSAHSGVNFYLGNNPVANGYPRIPPGLRSSQEGMLQDSVVVAEEEIRKQLAREGKTDEVITREQVSLYWGEKAKAYIRNNPTEWAHLMLRKAGNFWNRFVYDDLSVMTPFRERGILLPGISFGLLSLLGVPGMLLALFSRKCKGAGWVAWAMLLHFAALMPVFITERYRLAITPGLALFAAYGAVTCLCALRHKEWRMPVVYCALTGLWALVVFAPRNDPRLAALDLYNSGIVYLEEGEFDKAQAKLEASEKLVSDNTEMQFALGNLWMRQGLTEKASAFYHRALELDPHHKGTLNNLGYLALEENQPARAEAFFTASLKEEPRDAKTWYLLAMAQLALDNREAAESAIRRALELRPEQAEFIELKKRIIDHWTSGGF